MNLITSDRLIEAFKGVKENGFKLISITTYRKNQKLCCPLVALLLHENKEFYNNNEISLNDVKEKYNVDIDDDLALCLALKGHDISTIKNINKRDDNYRKYWSNIANEIKNKYNVIIDKEFYFLETN
jgi:hypothetical protein